MEIETRALTPDLAEIENMRKQAKLYGGGTEGWQKSLRESAMQMVRESRIRGYLAFDDGVAVGWCNANDRMNYFRVGEFDLDNAPEDRAPSDCERKGQIRSIVCFEISPDYRGRGIATQLLNKVCDDAREEGYEYVEAYPTDGEQNSLAFTGPVRMYEKTGFTEFRREGSTIVMRKRLM